MIGFSFYLQDKEAEEQILYAASLGITKAFTSLHIPEESGALTSRMSSLLKVASENGIAVHADVSSKTLKHLGLTSFDELASLGISSVRLDFGFELEMITSLADIFSISINASTVTEKELQTILSSGVQPHQLIAWHNFYPRIETGIDEDFFHYQNEMFQKYEIPIAAFIPGNEPKRGPLYAGLPTLEKHRNISPYVAGIEMLQYVNDVYIGDPGVQNKLLERLFSYCTHNIIEIEIESSIIQTGLYQVRPDVSRDLYRLQDTRVTSNIAPENTFARKKGTITMDNNRYGRYKGEVQICKRKLPADSRVNIIGHVLEENLLLLDLLMPSQKIKLLNG